MGYLLLDLAKGAFWVDRLLYNDKSITVDSTIQSEPSVSESVFANDSYTPSLPNPIDSSQDYPKNPDVWVPPPGVSETETGEITGGKHRQWKDEDGSIVRRWDRGEPGKPGFRGKDHWHDQSGQHILP